MNLEVTIQGEISGDDLAREICSQLTLNEILDLIETLIYSESCEADLFERLYAMPTDDHFSAVAELETTIDELRSEITQLEDRE